MFDSLERHRPTALAGLRIITGLMFMQHGTQKIFSFPAEARGPFELMSQMGIGGLLELVGGALIVLGLFTRPVAFLLSGMMAVAYFQFHAMSGGLFPMVNGGELAALYCWVFLFLFFAGPGAFSVDGMLAKKR